MHEPYEDRLSHKADFRVKYRFRSLEEGGRKTGTPFQGIRCDFSIVGEPENLQYKIWPEFEDEHGNVNLFNDNHLPIEGTARMWIINPEMRPVHYSKIKVGMKCNFREGPMYSADCEVIEILDLMNNPTKN
ncbi:hypothetical protein [Croceimicrobium hydrocarbonivorans]|uniref:Uncharacterized protein n=1 Tax=Croceimicrobium hydrocarbonivorans TaxID=2761580 RepID=A0A7H0VGM9_9FLAO|nr:hypothetical protein [Croceimicrobium hydrocarbonivorans]QNR24877.1 hypothetical protein H4K34_03280 [Croceimicrobium hydrocarbonivorans]